MDEPIFYEQLEDNDTSLQNVMQRVADSFQDAISEYPEQWYNFYKYWES